MDCKSHAPLYQLSDIMGTIHLQETYDSFSRNEADYDYWDRSLYCYEIHQRFNRGDDPYQEAERIPSRRAVNRRD